MLNRIKVVRKVGLSSRFPSQFSLNALNSLIFQSCRISFWHHWRPDAQNCSPLVMPTRNARWHFRWQARAKTSWRSATTSRISPAAAISSIGVRASQALLGDAHQAAGSLRLHRSDRQKFKLLLSSFTCWWVNVLRTFSCAARWNDETHRLRLYFPGDRRSPPRQY